MIDHDNTDNYLDPILHDLESTPFIAEGSFLLTLAQAANGPVLELGCGTGRVTIPLAQEGIEITGLDVMPQMLAHARAKAGPLPIRWVEADVRHFQLKQKYALIFARGSVLEHLFTLPEQAAMLSNVREHLADDGRFMLDAALCHPNRLVNCDEEPWFTYQSPKGHTVHVSGSDQFDYQNQIHHQNFFRRWKDEDGTSQSHEVKLALRYIMPKEMEALFHYNGLVVLDRFSDWDGSSVTDESDQILYLCGKG
ncbi:MAG: class I SAM-dependent methyltransferase [Chloroflexota bacterium]